MNTRSLSVISMLLTAGMMLLSSGCATTQGVQGTDVAENDPYEGFNRSIYSFNDSLDKAILKPVATGYQNITPQPVRTGVSNFFSNLTYPIVIINDVLQGKIGQGVEDTSRLFVNTTVGLLGILDPATPLGMQAHDEDFGQTLAVWGAGEGPYLVLPFFGSRNVRDTGGLVVDGITNPISYVGGGASVGLYAARTVETRERLLSAGRILDEAALDPYSFTREAYRQRRESLIHDGNVPDGSSRLKIE